MDSKGHRPTSWMVAFTVLFKWILSILPFPENVCHVDGCFLQHVIADVRVNVRRGLVVAVADDLHGDQRFNTCFIEHGHVVVSEEMRRQGRLHLLADVVRTSGIRIRFAGSSNPFLSVKRR